MPGYGYTNLKDVAPDLKRWAKRLGFAVNLALWRVAARAPDIIRRTSRGFAKRPKASGRYEVGWTHRKSGRGAVIFNRFPHARFVDEGRAKNKRPPPIAAILAWMKVKGIPANRGHAFAIAAKIGRKGIKARPVLARAMPAIRREISTELAKLVR